ncbi:YczE/YyaS/YitT family protein [[Bacillus] enclensis]|uniref:YczE/YyaS/YitT family protein n=1 Tax=[Bacillus] enclensis TaxID=1402860 RepID=UPI0018DE0A25|nr:YitT family protein [[Bacillus] enclensis]MBH9967580.1 YitT family protein [[Bacillus] enclensis]QWC23207.1 YitT family protein [Bacillus haikouensis]
MKVRFTFYCIGLLCLSFGVSLIIKGNLGAAPWDALAVGESYLFHLSIGTCIFLNGCILIVINALLLRERIEWPAALSIFLIGMMVDFWIKTGLSQVEPAGFTQQLSFVLAGILILGFGISIYLQAKLPSSPMDTFMIALHRRFGLNLRNARLLNEAIAITLAMVFHGAVGIGTVIVACTLGFIIHFFYPIMEHMYGKYTG